MPTLSALVIAHNEEERLEACLSKLSFVDELVVVLDRCTDKTRDIALAHKAKLVEGGWPLEGPRRHAGMNTCTCDWVLEVDADEHVSPELAAEIQSVLRNPQLDADFFRIPFDNYIGKRLVRYGWGAQFGVTARITLTRRGVKSWGDQHVHPKVVLTGKNGGILENRMIHWVDRDISDMIDRLDRYTTLNAEDIYATNNMRTLRKNVARIFGRFWKCYVLRKGYKEGGMGLVIALFAGLYPFLSYMKACEIRDAKKGQ